MAPTCIYNPQISSLIVAYNFILIYLAVRFSSLSQARGPKKHLKRLNAPKHWMLDKLSGRYVSHVEQQTYVRI
jgi:small subunit ribosomal protein S4e